MTRKPKPGHDHEGYWAEWTWQPARDMANGGYWYHDVRLNIFPGADGCYSVSYGETWQPERPATFLQAEEVAFAIDAPHQALVAEVERLRSIVGAWQAWHENLSLAMQADLENGVRCLNERAAAEFAKRYPETHKALGDEPDFEELEAKG